MLAATQIGVPSLVRIKPGALARTGIYLSRAQRRRVVVLTSEGMPAPLSAALEASLKEHAVELVSRRTVDSASFEEATALLPTLPAQCDAIVGFGGGRALDTAKYLAFLARQPYLAVPTSLSN